MSLLLLGVGLRRRKLKDNRISNFILSMTVYFLWETEACKIAKTSFSEIFKIFTKEKYGGMKFAGSTIFTV